MELQLSREITAHSGEELQQEGREYLLSHDMVGLERKLSEYVGVEHCVCVNSATTALVLALKALGIGKGDGVLCTSFSYFATADIIELAGGKPVFVDINPNTYGIDPYCLEYVIGKCNRRGQPLPKALIAVDLFGLPCNYDALEKICNQHGIILIEDMAQSFGAMYKGRRTGGFGRMAVASFFPAKPLSELGEGGAVFCHKREDARRLQSLRRSIRMREDRSLVGGGFLDMVQANVVEEKLKIFDLELDRRRQVAERYRGRLEGAVKLQQVGEEYAGAYTHFVIALKDIQQRERMMEQMQRCHIPVSVFEPFAPGRERPSGQDRVALVNAQSVAQRILTIPMHPYLSGRVVDYICERILEELESMGGIGEELRVNVE